jgi:hypothetical protein
MLNSQNIYNMAYDSYENKLDLLSKHDIYDNFMYYKPFYIGVQLNEDQFGVDHEFMIADISKKIQYFIGMFLSVSLIYIIGNKFIDWICKK